LGGDHRMGLLWRLFAPKPLKKARRTVSKASHTAHRNAAVTPSTAAAFRAVSWAKVPGAADVILLRDGRS
jgi:hypothetical protein